MNLSNSLAFVFPGQGSQSVGMLSAVAAKAPIIRETFEEASNALGYDLFALTQVGPAEKLNQTEFTQPALLTASVALWRFWLQSRNTRPSLLAGHSLGEYSALVCAESLTLKDAVQLVALRGRLMQNAVPEGEGAMAAILGLTDDEVKSICDEASSRETSSREASAGDKTHSHSNVEIVAAANFNTIGQVVISGQTAAVLRAMEIAKAKGAKRAIQLPVSVPSHCELMKPAALLLAQALEEIDFKLPTLPVIHNVDVSVQHTVQNIRQALVDQLYQPVRWVETIQKMADKGITTVLECGPGTVLTGLNKRIVTTLVCHSLLNGEEAYDYE